METRDRPIRTGAWIMYDSVWEYTALPEHCEDAQRLIGAPQIALYECDVCSDRVPRGSIANVIAYGIETGACVVCRGSASP